MDGAKDRLAAIATLTWFPLVARPRPPGLPLQARIAELTSLAAQTADGTRRDRMSRAAEVFNKAALIASDCGMCSMARALCHRQHELFGRVRPLPAWAIQLALQPILNIPRQLIREGRGQDAYAMLETLYHAARERNAAVIDGRPVDFSTMTRVPDDHKTVCTLIWTALLADGTRALILAGRWQDAARHTEAYRGTGRRLLDGRQTTILALAQDGQAGKAAMMVEQSLITEPWEHAVQRLLRVLCMRAVGTAADQHVIAMLADARALTEEPDRSTTVMRTRVGMIALDLAGINHESESRLLRTGLIAIARWDARAARDILAHHQVRQYLTTVQCRDLRDLVRISGLGNEMPPERLLDQLSTAVHHAETTLKRELKQQE